MALRVGNNRRGRRAEASIIKISDTFVRGRHAVRLCRLFQRQQNGASGPNRVACDCPI